MRDNESELEIVASEQKIDSNEKLRFSDLTKTEEVFTGLLYSYFVVAPVVNLAIYSTLLGMTLYYALK